MKVAVLGSGADALAVAADLSRHGRDVTLADLDGSAIEGAGLVTVVVPPSAHARAAAAIADHVTEEQAVLFLGDGSGAIVARRVIDAPTLIAESNTLPCPARLTGPGEITALAAPGAVLIAALPANPTAAAHVVDLVSDVWPHAAATDTVWSTALSGYNAIEKVLAMIATSGNLQVLAGSTLWAEEATTEAEIVIETVDNELLALRGALNSRERRRYQDFLAARPDDTTRPGGAATTDTPDIGSPDIAESVAGSLVLASSLGAATGVPTPVVDGLVDVASAMLGRDFRAEGRTLATLGLDGLDTTGLIGFARTGIFP